MNERNLRGLRVGIVGASVAGLATARFLGERGADVTLFERSRARLEERGGGIAMDPDVVRVLGPLRGRSIEGRVVVGVSGRPLWTTLARKFMTAWSEVYSALHARVPEALVRRGWTVDRCEPSHEGALLHFRRQPPERFDLVVGADGLGSVVRRAVAPEFEPDYVGYVAIRGHVPEASLPDACDPLRRWADSPGLVNCYGPRTHVVAYWIPGAADNVLNWMWYRNVERDDLAEFMSDAKGTVHHWSLPPGALPDQRRESLLRELTEIFPDAFSSAASTTENVYLQAVYKGSPARTSLENVVLVGDAAHVAVPHIGAGSSFAVRDAASLAEAIDGADAARSLANWAVERRDATSSSLAVAAELGRALQHEDHDWERWTPNDFDAWWGRLVGRHRLYFNADDPPLPTRPENG